MNYAPVADVDRSEDHGASYEALENIAEALEGSGYILMLIPLNSGYQYQLVEEREVE